MRKKIKGLLISAHFGTAIVTAIITVYPLIKNKMPQESIISTVITIITSTMIGFLINDLFDIERDKVNKPYRPLVKQDITSKHIFLWCIVFFIIFTYFIVKLIFYSYAGFYIFLYFLFYIMYNFVNNINGIFKNITIAIGFVFPYMFVISYLNVVGYNIHLIISTFFFFLYRELLMDINDKEGDYKTGLLTIPTRVSDSTAHFIVSLYWFLAVIFLTIHVFAGIYKRNSIIFFLIIVCILSVQNLIWNNVHLTKRKMRILLISMWFPMSLSVLLIKF